MITELGGKKVSPIGIGTWGMGGGKLGLGHGMDKEEIESIRYALKNGINLIDTAEMYGFGKAEQLVAESIKGFERDNIFITTKVAPHHLSREKLISSAKASLSRLKTHYLDLYLIHWPVPGMNFKETIGAMEDLVDAGLVNSIGVSNFSVKDMQDAMAATKRYTIEANQIHYSLIERACERDVIPFCEKNKIKVIAYTPLAKGKVLSMKDIQSIARLRKKPPAQVALQYLMKRSLPIPKAATLNHMKELVGTGSWELSSSDYALLKSNQ
jgi:diketogulonate reductase-like aldo/keto reductase